MAGTVDDFPILLRLVYILVSCSMFDHVFFLIHTSKNPVGDGTRWHEMQIWMMFLCLFISLSLNHDLNNWQRGVAELVLFGCRSAESEVTRHEGVSL
jgi:hypothetical protein